MRLASERASGRYRVASPCWSSSSGGLVRLGLHRSGYRPSPRSDLDSIRLLPLSGGRSGCVRGEKDCRSGWFDRWLRAVFSSTVHLVGRHWKVRAQKMQFQLATAPSSGPIRVGRASEAEPLPCNSGRKIGTGGRMVRRTSIAWCAAANREYTSPWLDPRSREAAVPPAGRVPHPVRPSVPRLRGGWHATG